VSICTGTCPPPPSLLICLCGYLIIASFFFVFSFASDSSLKSASSLEPLFNSYSVLSSTSFLKSLLRFRSFSPRFIASLSHYLYRNCVRTVKLSLFPFLLQRGGGGVETGRYLISRNWPKMETIAESWLHSCRNIYSWKDFISSRSKRRKTGRMKMCQNAKNVNNVFTFTIYYIQLLLDTSVDTSFVQTLYS
jgi:hypothetical protein